MTQNTTITQPTSNLNESLTKNTNDLVVRTIAHKIKSNQEIAKESMERMVKQSKILND